MSEVIENFIRRHPALSEKDAFDGFLQEERIKAWVGDDDTRRERLRREFGRVWGTMQGEGAVTRDAPAAKTGPAGPSTPASHGRTLHVEVRPEIEERPVAPVGTAAGPGAATTMHQGAHALGGGRRLQVMCPTCMRIEVWLGDDNAIACRRCGREYDDMLALIRVTPVGPFEFIFGQGWQGWATAAGIAAAVLALYGVLRWV